MSHEIEHTDTVISTKEEWHGLQIIKDEIHPTIVDSDHRNVYFDIHEGTAYADIDREKRQGLIDISSTLDGLSHSEVM